MILQRMIHLLLLHLCLKEGEAGEKPNPWDPASDSHQDSLCSRHPDMCIGWGAVVAGVTGFYAAPLVNDLLCVELSDPE